MNAYRFFVKVFALTFALGVVSGITMSFQFGTNWPGFMNTVGAVAGPLLAYEVLTAFFLEATFLGVMLFGFRKVPNWVHTLATFLVAFGTTMSAFWIIVLNSWMHTPAGYELRNGVVHATDWAAIIFNPSMPYRLGHMLLASGLTCAFLLAGLSAWRWLRQDRGPDVMAALRTGVTLAALLIPAQILVGDMHGLNTLEHQPAKVAAMEGNWETGGHVPLVLFALPNEKERRNDFEIAVPNGASLILKHEAAGVIPGLNQFVAPDGTKLQGNEKTIPVIIFLKDIYLFERQMVVIYLTYVMVKRYYFMQGNIYHYYLLTSSRISCSDFIAFASISAAFFNISAKKTWSLQSLAFILTFK